MKTRLFSLVVAAGFLAGCASTKIPIAPKLTLKDFPAAGEERTAELGDTILEKSRIYELPALDLQNEVHTGDGFFLKKMTVYPGILVAESEDHWGTYYFAPRFTIYDAMIGTIPARGGLTISKTNQSRVWIFSPGVAGGGVSPAPIFRHVMAPAPSPPNPPSFRWELVYNGRSGDQLKLLYREFTGDMIRSAFNQEASYDLGASKEIGFKGARIEVIEASNTQIRYKVLKSFPDMP